MGFSNYNIITFNDEYFKSHLELFKYSLIYSKSTKDYKTKYDKSICDILDTYEHIKKPSNSRNADKMPLSLFITDAE